MNLAEIHALADDDPEFPVRQAQVQLYEGELCIGDLVPLPVCALSNSVGTSQGERPSDLLIVDERQSRLGVICLGRELGQVDLNAMTEAQFASYLHAVEQSQYGLPYRFSSDYIVLDRTRFVEYRDHYLPTSAVWGGFVHESVGSIQPYKHLPAQITAVGGLTFPTSFHEEASRRSVAEPYAFERFLKLYHLLELLFDWDLVRRIQTLGPDLLGVGKLLAEYNRDELARLKDILRERCTNTNAICLCIDKVLPYRDIAKLMFFTYGKAGNSINGPQAEKLFDDLLDHLPFSEASARDAKISRVKSPETFHDFALETAAYWVYRVRCSIAHNRIGEYVVTSADEEFIVNFAEPLLRELLCQALASHDI